METFHVYPMFRIRVISSVLLSKSRPFGAYPSLHSQVLSLHIRIYLQYGLELCFVLFLFLFFFFFFFFFFLCYVSGGGGDGGAPAGLKFLHVSLTVKRGKFFVEN